MRVPGCESVPLVWSPRARGESSLSHSIYGGRIRESLLGRFPGPHLSLARETDEGGNILRCADFRYANRTHCMRLSGQFRDSRETDSFEVPARVHQETDRVRT